MIFMILPDLFFKKNGIKLLFFHAKNLMVLCKTFGNMAKVLLFQ